MVRQIYLTAMGAAVGAAAAAAFGHMPLWVGIGVALGLVWARFAPEAAETSLADQYPILLRPALLRAWVTQVIALRRVSFVIGLA